MTDVVVVAIPTYKRSAALASALASVGAQVTDRDRLADLGVDAEILVVDNDAEGSGEATALAHDVRYVREPRPGIAAVRNRALRESPHAQAIIFLDDDEVPEPGWLPNLLTVYRETGATAVAGKVLTRFPDDVEPWVRASGAFVRPVRSHGQAMREAATNNLLLDLPSVTRLGLSFDERFGLTGGSDSMFTRELTTRGGTIRWAEDAVVTEQEEAARFTRRWVLMRTFRFGNTAARVDIALAGSTPRRLAQRARNLLRGLARVVGGGVRWLRGAVTGSLAHRARGLRTVYRGFGMIAAATGYAHDEYGRRRKKNG